jgi:hypothetical protein
MEDQSMEQLLALSSTVTATFEELRAHLGSAIAHAESGGTTIVLHGSTERPRAVIAPLPGGPGASGWAGQLHDECARLSRAYNQRPVAGGRAEAERLVRRTVYGAEADEVPLSAGQAAAEIEAVAERNSGLRSLGGDG